jgi:hypothetical protein
MTPLEIAMLVPCCIIGFALVWFAILTLIAYLSGWHLLATRFRATAPFIGPEIRIWHVSMLFRTEYDNVIYLGADPNGLHLRMNVLFSIGHPPLFIPWDEIIIGAESRYLFFIPVTKLELGREAKIPFRIWGRKAQQLLALAGVRPMALS